MVLSVEVGQFTKDATNVDGATQNISTGFDPKAIIVWGTRLQTSNGLGDGDVSYSHGFSDGTNNVCNGSDGEDGVGTEVSQLTIRNNRCIFFGAVSGGATDASATITFGTNQFTVTWNTNDSVATVINYIVIGGSSITGVQAGSFLKSTAGAPVTQNVTIDSDVQNIDANGGVVFFASPDHDTLNNMTGDLDIGLGVAVPSSGEGQYHISNDTGVGTSEVFQTYSESKCMVITDSDSGVLQAEADFTSITTTLNITWTTNDAQASPIIFLIIKGGRWQTGNETALTAGSTKDTTTLFTPTGLITIAGRRTTEGTSQQTGSFVIGARANSTEICGGFSELDANTTMFYGRTLSNTKAIQILDQGAGAPTVNGEADASFGTNKFTMDWTNLASSAWKFLWVVMADQPKQEFTCDAIVVNRFDKTFTCDAILVNRFDANFTVDALLETTQTFNFLVDALLELETTKLFLVDALLEKTFDETFTCDARLSVLEEFTVDARLAQRKDFTCDSILVNRFDKTFICDARLSALAEFDINAILKAIFTKTFTVDAILKATQTFNFLIDALLEEEQTKLFLIDAFLELRQDETITVDARLRKVQSNTFTCDALVKLVQTKTFTIDARLAQVKTFKIDGIVIKAIQFKVDGFPQATLDFTFTIDSIIIVFPSKVFNCDSILVNRFDYTFTIDARLRARFDKTFLVDSLLKKTQDKTFTIDASLETASTKTFTIDARLKGIFSKTFLVDAYLRKTQTKTFTIDTFAEEATNKTFLIDGLLEQTFTKTFTIDVYSLEAMQFTFTVDAYLRKTLTKTFTCDVIIIIFPSAVTLIDALISLSHDKTFKIDAILKAIFTQTFACDARLRARFDYTFTIDARLYAPIYKTFTVDGYLISAKTKTFTIDVRLEQVKTKTFSIDGITTADDTKIFTVDARLRKTQETTFTIQALLRYVNNKTYTIDALVKALGDNRCGFIPSAELITDQIFFPPNSGFGANGWSTEINSHTHNGFGAQRIFIDNESPSTAGRTLVGLRAGGYNPYPIWVKVFKTKYRRKRLDFDGGIGIVRGGYFRVEFDFQLIQASGGTWLALSQSGLHPQDDLLTPYLMVTASGQGITTSLDDGVNVAGTGSITTAPLLPILNPPRYVVIESSGNTLTLNIYSDSAHTTHLPNSPKTVNTATVNKNGLNFEWLIIGANPKFSGPANPTGQAYLDNIRVYSSPCPEASIDSILQATTAETFTVDALLNYQTQFTCDVILKKSQLKTFTVDTFAEVATNKIFTVDAYLTRVYRFDLDAVIKALGDNRCVNGETIFHEQFTTTSGWSPEINNTGVEGWGTQKIFIDGEAPYSSGIAYVQMRPGGYDPFDVPILKSKYRRKKLDFYGGIGKIRGNNIRLEFEFTLHQFALGGIWLGLNKSSAHPYNDPNTPALYVIASLSGGLRASLSDGVNVAGTPTTGVPTGGVKHYVVVESLGNTLTISIYTDPAHTIHIVNSPKTINTSTVNKEQLDMGWLILGANPKTSGQAHPTAVGEIDNVKVFASPCPVAYIDAHLSGTNVKSFLVSAKLVRLGRFTIDARLRGRKIFKIDAKLIKPKSFNIDAILRGRFKTFTVDPLLKGAVSKTIKIDGITFKVPSNLITIDARLVLLDQQKTFTVDSILSNIILLTFETNAKLKGTINKQFSINARIKEVNINTFSVDAFIEMFGQNGVCNFYPNTVFAIDTGLEYNATPVTPIYEETVDILMGQEVILNNQQVRRVTVLLRASGFPNEIIEDSFIVGKIWGNVVIGNLLGETVEATSENTINAKNTAGDLTPSVWTEVTFTYDPFTTPFLTGNYVIGLQHFVGANTNVPQGVGIAIPVISGGNVIYGSAVKRKEDNSMIDPFEWKYLTSESIDIVIRVEVVNGNDIVQPIGKICPKLDARLKGVFTETFTVDANTYLPIYKTFEVDAELVTIKIKTFKIDTILVGAVQNPKLDAILIPSPVTFKIDGILIVEPSKVFGVDSVLKGTISEPFLVSANLQVNNLNKIFNCNALIAEIKTKTFTIDGTTKYFDKVAPFITDAFLIDEPSKFFFVNAIIKDLEAISMINVDADLQITVPFEFTIDAVLKKENMVSGFLTNAILIVYNKEITFTIRASLALSQPPVYFTVNAIINLQNSRWRNDSLLRARKTKNFTSDALLADRIELTNIVDAVVKEIGVLEDIEVDALVKKTGVLTFVIDTFSEQAKTKVFTVDSKLFFPFKMIIVDSKVVNRKIETLIVDALIDPTFTSKVKVDTILKGTINELFTIDALVGIGQVPIKIDAKLNRTKTFTIDAFAGELIDVGIEGESGVGDIVETESSFGVSG